MTKDSIPTRRTDTCNCECTRSMHTTVGIRSRSVVRSSALALVVICGSCTHHITPIKIVQAFTIPSTTFANARTRTRTDKSHQLDFDYKYSRKFSTPPNDDNANVGASSSDDGDANRWISTDETYDPQWENEVMKRQDGSLWSSFESTSDDDEDESNSNGPKSESSSSVMDDGEIWLEALASVAADEINFINKEADRADKQRQMQEWGFEADTIANTLDLAKDDRDEIDVTNDVFEAFKEETAKTGFGMYLDDDEDLETVESHTRVEFDEESGEPVRTQMVYVDEVTCIGCTHCAGIAQSTFFMESELGRARVFQQWGDDEETIEIAIDTCPVNCIHYVPYEELVGLEIQRRDQSINVAGGLVSRGEGGGGGGIMPRFFGGTTFTGQQTISGNMGSRCNNCPGNGCGKCPMFGVGKNPAFEKKEKERKDREVKKRMQQQMVDSNRIADL